MKQDRLTEKFLKSRNNDVPMLASFGYGSGVFKQKGYTLEQQSMIDLILIVKNAREWHNENKQKNPNDYPLGAKIMLGKINFERIPFLTGITYQTHISFEDHLFKYGVISADVFKEQMNTWSSFFLPGRFQKPVKPYSCNLEISECIYRNRLLALLVALYTLPENQYTLLGLYTQICSLSYRGDIRMLFVENPRKVQNIVEAEFDLFIKMYGTQTKYFETQKDGSISIHQSLVEEDLNLLLPDKYRNAFLISKEELLSVIEKKNRQESITQPLIGSITAGPIKSLKYVAEKMKKKTKSE